MIGCKIVLVLGAGASVPYGFPDGSTLVRQIVQTAQGGSAYDAFSRWSGGKWKKDRIDLFCSELQESGWWSIDRFLQHRPDLQDIGKAMIAYYLMKCEQPETLDTYPNNLGRWYQYFYNELLRPKSPDELAKNPLSVITYNYDRSFEFYLYRALRAGFKLSPEDALAHSRAIPVVHMHGSLGELPPDERGRPYAPTVEGFVEASANLHIVSDDIESSGVIEKKCRPVLQAADRIIFLGFGYDRTNLGRLPLPPTEYHGTMYGLTHSERTVHAEYFQRRAGRQLAYTDPEIDCLQFLRHRRQLF
jgi:hypothetical protein